jgi:hypothetical protein
LTVPDLFLTNKDFTSGIKQAFDLWKFYVIDQHLRVFQKNDEKYSDLQKFFPLIERINANFSKQGNLGEFLSLECFDLMINGFKLKHTLLLDAESSYIAKLNFFELE